MEVSAIVRAMIRNGIRLPTFVGLSLTVFLSSFLVSGAARAQSSQVTNGFVDYEKRIRSSEMIGALKADLFGDGVSLYNGATEFTAVDIEVPGNNPLPVKLGRRFKVDVKTSVTLTSGGFGADIRPLGGFGTWDIDVPYLYGMFDASYGWRVGQGVTQRCSGPALPRVTSPFEVNDVWSGYHLRIPGEGDAELTLLGSANSSPADGNVYRWGTRSMHRARCIPSTLNYPGEGFVVLDTNGTAYTFNYAITRDGGVVEKSGVTLMRQQVFLMATRVQDRHGNYVDYHYSGDRLNRITASDGRSIDIYWAADSIDRVVAHGREWRYFYGSSMVVQLPDGSRWQYEPIGSLYVTPAPPVDDGGACAESLPATATAFSMKITHPSGARGVFDFGYLRHGRSGTPASACTVDRIDEHGTVYRSLKIPDYSYSYSLLSKKISGPGVAEMQWTYGWDDPATGRANFGGAYCSFCDPDRSAYVREPDGVTKQYLFGALWNHNEGRLLGIYTRDAANRLVKSEVHEYVSEQDMQAGMPFPNRHGELTASDNVSGLLNRPLKKTVISQDGDIAGPVEYVPPTTPPTTPPPVNPGDPGPPVCEPQPPTYTCDQPLSIPGGPMMLMAGMTTASTGTPATAFVRQVNTFDVHARPVSVTLSNSMAGSVAKTEVTAYYDNTAKWILGQTAKLTVNGIVASETTFDGMARPITYKTFGRLKQTLTYNTDGTVATVRDGNNNVTTASNWKRGIPQTIQHPATPEAPAGATESAVVNDHGWITSVTDENGYKTCYGYDAMGRISQVTHPSESTAGVCDTTTWAATTQVFQPVAAAEYGIPAGHWRQTVSTGNARKITYFDALWRPLVTREYDTANEAGTQRFQRFTYDHDGRVTFASYPGTTDALSTGTWTIHDALGRVRSVSQNSEHGLLTTLTEYLPGSQTRVTNPRNQQTTTSYQAFDQPSYENPVLIQHPEGAVTEISRDVLGMPLAITRRNASGSQSVTRRYVYGTLRRLCMVIEPETGASVFGYDGADNLMHSAAGLPVPGGSLTWPESGNTCAAAMASAGNRRVDRTYDARNRLKTLVFPDGKGNQAWEYWPDGLPRQVTTSNDAATSGIVKNSYAYNKRRLPVGESLEQVGWYSWGLGYGYDANGSLSTQTYPTGLTISYAPNALGQATQARDQSGYYYASGASYYPNGALKQFTYGNGIVHSMSQNARQLPQDVVSSGGVLHERYTYDQNGNVASILDVQDGGHLAWALRNRWMQYDGLDRLTAVGSGSFGGDHWHRFTYDALDNLTSWKLGGVKDYATYVYDGKNQLASIKNTGGATIVGFGYDPQGNLNNKNGQGYTFDYGNRLRDVAGKEWYRYDGHGRRVLSWPGVGSGMLSMYSNAGQVMYQEDYKNGKNQENIYLAGSIVAIRELAHAGGVTAKYQHTDALGSPVAVTNMAGTVIERNDYEPYGAIIGKPNYQGIGYTGHVQDGATGLTYMQQRYYDPICGCFLSVDPITAYDTGDWRHFNRYAYAYNNPYKFKDPDGRFGVVGALIGAGIEAGLQIATEGKVTNWTAVGVAGAVGAVTGGLGGVIGKAAVSGTITTGRAVVAAAAVGGAAGATGKVAEGALTGKGTSAKEVAVAAAAGAVGGGVGGKVGLSTVAKVESMAASNGIAGHVGRTTQAAMQQGGKIVEPSTSAGQKVGQTAADTASSYVEKRVNKY